MVQRLPGRVFRASHADGLNVKLYLTRFYCGHGLYTGRRRVTPVGYKPS